MKKVIVDAIKKLHDKMETVNEFCYFKDRLKASSGCQAALLARVRVDWVICS